MSLLVRGRLNKQVGAELGISEITVKAHRGRMIRKVSAGSLAELVMMAASLRHVMAAITADREVHAESTNPARFQRRIGRCASDLMSTPFGKLEPLHALSMTAST